MSGYELARLFEGTLARAWPAQHPQIYPALASLEEHGLIHVSEEGPRRRKTYAITEEGREEVQRWLRETSPDRRSRNEAILRVFFLWLLHADEAISFFDDEIVAHERKLAGFEQTRADDERRQHGADTEAVAFAAGLALEWGLRYEREYIEWAKWARKQVARRERSSDGKCPQDENAVRRQ